MVENHQHRTGNSPAARGRIVRDQLSDLGVQMLKEIKLVDEPRFQALLETPTEVLEGLKTAFSHYMEGREMAWRRG